MYVGDLRRAMEGLRDDDSVSIVVSIGSGEDAASVLVPAFAGATVETNEALGLSWLRIEASASFADIASAADLIGLVDIDWEKWYGQEEG